MKASEAKPCASNGVSQVTEIQVGLDGISFATAKNSRSRRSASATSISQSPRPRLVAQYGEDLARREPEAAGPPDPRLRSADDVGHARCLAEDPDPAVRGDFEHGRRSRRPTSEVQRICTAVRTDGAYIEAGENDNLIVQKLEANPGTIGVFGYSYLEENAGRLKGLAINGVTPSYDRIACFKYPGARPLFIYLKNAHVNAIPAMRAYALEFTKESAFGPKGYLLSAGMIASPNGVRARSQQLARVADAARLQAAQIDLTRESAPKSGALLQALWTGRDKGDN